MKNLLFLVLLASTAGLPLFSQPAVVVDEKYGTTYNEFSRVIRFAADSNQFIIAGEKQNPAGGYDLYLASVHQFGSVFWEHTYGFAQNDRMQEGKDNAMQVITAPNGTTDGFILTGTTETGAGDLNIFIVRTDNLGGVVWSQTFGGSLDDKPSAVRETSDGGFLIVAETESFGVSGGSDVYLVKIDANGAFVWDATYNLSGSEGANDVVELASGSFLVFCSGSHLFRVEADGDPDPNYGTTAAQPGVGSKDRNFAFNYNTVINGGDGTMLDPLPGGDFIGCGNVGSDCFLVKLDASGNILSGWPQTIVQPGNNSAHVVHPILDATSPGYLVAGKTDGQGAGGTDAWLFRTDAVGNLLWQQTYGGTANEDFSSLHMLPGGFGYALTGEYGSTGAGTSDFWVLQLEDPDLFTIIEGTLFLDNNNNCTNDGGTEYLIQNQVVQLSPGPVYAMTNPSGKYRFKVSYGSYVLSLLANPAFQTNPCMTPPTIPLTVANGQTYTGNDFPLQALPGSTCEGSVNVVSAPFATGFCANTALRLATPCPGAPHVYQIYLYNRSNQNLIQLAQSTVQMVLPEGMNFTGFSFDHPGGNGSFSTPILSTQGQREVLTWNGSNMAGQISLLGYCMVRCSVSVQTIPPAPLPYQVNAQFDAFCTSQLSHLSSYNLAESNACSCDPNDKLVSPKGCGPDGRIAFGQTLTYRVRFENVGTGPAHDVMIRDVLDSDFDPFSLQILGSDHTITGVQLDPGNELVIHFTGIELQPNATGEVFFSLDHLPGLSEGTILTNSAEIYFDLNPPVITNTELNTLYNDPGITYDTWYKDQDNDGYSNSITQQSCVQPNGYKLSGSLIATSGDCNDTNGGIHPAATEVCNSIDDDCNGLTDAADPSLTDTKKPTPFCNSGLVFNLPAAGFVTVNATALDLGSYDDCPGALTISMSLTGANYVPSLDFHCTGTFTIYLGVTDAAGNFDFCITFIDVQDNMGNSIPPPPNVTCNNQIQFALNANCQAVINIDAILEGGPYGPDCWYFLEIFQGPGFTNPVVSGYGTVVIPSGYAGQTLVYRITNTDSGNSCSGMIQLTDNTAPIITCPSNQTIPADAFCEGMVGAWGPATVGDNCTAVGNINVVQLTNPSTLLSGHNDVRTVTLKATDGSGNMNTCSFTVTLIDVTPPVIACPGNQNRSACNYTAVGSEFDVSLISENCLGGGFTADWILTGATTGNGLTSLAATVFPTGVTTVQWTMTDGAGNLATCSFTVTVAPGTEICDGIDNDCDNQIDEDAPSVTLNPFPSVCLTAPAFSLTGGLPAGGTYSGPGVSSGQFNPSVAGAGTHTITYSYTDANNCTGTAMQTIQVNALPTVTLANLAQVCLNTLPFALTGGLPTGGTYSGKGVSAGQFNASVAGVGTHTITYSYTNANNCIGTATNTITVNAPPTVTIAGFSPVCVNAAAFLLANGSPVGGIYSGPGVLAGQFNPATAGTGTHTITYSYTDANGCTGTATKTITVNAAPTIANAGADRNICQGSSVTLSANAPTVGLGSWSVLSGPSTASSQFSSVSSPAATFIPAGGPGTYQLQWSIANSPCPASTDILVLTVVASPTVSTPGNQTVCSGSPTAAVNFSGSPGAGFTWTCSDPSIGLPASGMGNIASFNALNSGNAPKTATMTVTPQVGGLAYIPNSGNTSISIINIATNTIIATIQTPGGGGANGICVSKDGSRVYIANTNSNNVTVLNTATNSVSYIPTPGGIGPHGICINSDGSRVYVGNIGSNNVSVINTATNAVSLIPTFPGGSPHGVCISTDDGRVYVTNINSNNISVINTLTNAVSTILTPFGSQPHGICTSPNGVNVYASNMGSQNVSVINTTTNAVTYLATPGVSVGYAICTSPDGSRVYVARHSNQVSVINTNTNAVTNIPIPGSTPWGLSATSDGSRIYVSNSQSNNVSFINTVTNSVIGNIGVGSTPQAYGSFITGTTCTGTPVTFTITVNPSPTTANAGPDQTNVCGLTTTTLAANTPTVGTGLWSVVSGVGGSFGNASSPTSTFSGTPGVLYTLRWTITNSFCPAKMDDVNIQFNQSPTTAAAGADRNICQGSSVTLAGNAPTAGTGTWSVSSGPSTASSQFSSLSNPTATFTPAGGPGTYQLQWSISNSPCLSTDFLVLTVIGTPIVATPLNQTVCNGNATNAVNFSGSPGANFTWTCSDPSIGLAASGTGNIPSFTAVNTGTSPKTATISVTPVISGGFAYISNYNSNNISVINTMTNTVIATIPIPNNSVGICVSPDGSKVYVSSGNVLVINTATNAIIATIPTPNGSTPMGISVSPDGSKVYVAATNIFFNNNVLVINTATNAIIATIPTPNASWLFGISVSPDGGKVYVANWNSSNVTVINTATNAVSYIPTPNGGNPYGICVSPDGSKVYVANFGSSNVTVINTATNGVTYIPTPNGIQLSGISISPDGSRVYVANTGTNNVTVINTATNAVIATIPTPNGIYPRGISVSPDGGKVYVANQGSNNSTVINTATNAVITTIPTLNGNEPFAFGNFITGPVCTGPPVTFTITVTPNIWYKDFDNDGYSDGVTQNACSQPLYYKLLSQLTAPPTGVNVDCNDNSSIQKPGQTWYKDQDNDGYGATGVLPISICARPLYYKAAVELIATTGDCQDGPPDNLVTGYPSAKLKDIYPGKSESCNGIDDDCDGVKDEGLSGLTYTPNPVTVVLTTQALVNSWPPCYTKIVGNVTISAGSVTSLVPLANLTEVTGNVVIQSASGLTSLTGLHNLTTIGGNLTIKSDNLLSSLAALGNLATVGGYVNLESNPALTSLTGLNNLTSIGGYLQIRSNSQLATLNGLNSTLTIGGNLTVILNPQLSNCCAIEHFILFGGVGGTINPASNKPPGNCNNQTQIINNCPLFTGGGSENLLSQPCADCPVGVDESQTPTLSLFPNPATDEVMVSLSETLSEDGLLRLYDAQGRLVFQQKTGEGEQSWTLSLADGKITNGLYLVALENRGKVLVERLVVQ